MSFQEKYKDYKEKKEAKNYFRSQNDLFLDSTQWAKTIGIGLLGAIACGIILGIIIYALHITSALFYLVCGYIIAMMMTRISGIHSQQIAIVSVVMTFLCFVVGEMTWIYLPFYEMGIGLQFVSIVDLFIESIKSLIVGDLFTTIIAILGMIIAYQQAQ